MRWHFQLPLFPISHFSPVSADKMSSDTLRNAVIKYMQATFDAKITPANPGVPTPPATPGVRTPPSQPACMSSTLAAECDRIADMLVKAMKNTRTWPYSSNVQCCPS